MQEHHLSYLGSLAKVQYIGMPAYPGTLGDDDLYNFSLFHVRVRVRIRVRLFHLPGAEYPKIYGMGVTAKVSPKGLDTRLK